MEKLDYNILGGLSKQAGQQIVIGKINELVEWINEKEGQGKESQAFSEGQDTCCKA